MNAKIIDNHTVEITGNIKSLEDYNEIKSVTQSLISKGSRDITLNILDSLSMVSSVIGYLIKMINVDGVRIHTNVWDERLYKLLDQLSLIDLFNVHKK